MTRDRCRLCLETSVADVLNQHTAPATNQKARAKARAFCFPTAGPDLS